MYIGSPTLWSNTRIFEDQFNSNPNAIKLLHHFIAGSNTPIHWTCDTCTTQEADASLTGFHQLLISYIERSGPRWKFNAWLGPETISQETPDKVQSFRGDILQGISTGFMMFAKLALFQSHAFITSSRMFQISGLIDIQRTSSVASCKNTPP